jgi:hypothetical protein
MSRPGHEPVVADAVHLEEVAHLSLVVSRLLLLNGAGTAQIGTAVMPTFIAGTRDLIFVRQWSPATIVSSSAS